MGLCLGGGYDFDTLFLRGSGGGGGGDFSPLHRLLFSTCTSPIMQLICLPNFCIIFFVISPGYRVFSHDVAAAILVSQNNETAAMLVSQTNPLGFELFSYANTFFCSNKFA